MNYRRLVASLLVGIAVGWGMWLAPLQWPRATLPPPHDANPSANLFFSPDGRELVTVHLQHGIWKDTIGNLGGARLWNVQSGRCISILAERTRLINSVAFSPDGLTIAGRQEDGRVFLWDRPSGKLLREIDRIDDVHPNAQIVYAPDGRLLFQVGQNWTLMRYLDTGKVAFDFRGEGAALTIGTINHQGFYLAAGKNRAAVVRLDTGERIATFVAEGNDMDTNGALSPDGQSYATTFWTNANQVVVWTSEAGVALPPIPWLEATWNTQSRLALANDAALLAVYTTYHPRKWIYFGEASKEPRHRIHLFDPKTAQEVGKIEGGQRATFSPDGRTLAVMMGNGDVQLWDVPMGKRWGWIALAAAGATALAYGFLRWRARRRAVADAAILADRNGGSV